jgi:hypothetical protein
VEDSCRGSLQCAHRQPRQCESGAAAKQEAKLAAITKGPASDPLAVQDAANPGLVTFKDMHAFLAAATASRAARPQSAPSMSPDQARGWELARPAASLQAGNGANSAHTPFGSADPGTPGALKHGSQTELTSAGAQQHPDATEEDAATAKITAVAGRGARRKPAVLRSCGQIAPCAAAVARGCSRTKGDPRVDRARLPEPPQIMEVERSRRVGVVVEPVWLGNAALPVSTMKPSGTQLCTCHQHNEAVRYAALCMPSASGTQLFTCSASVQTH